MKQGKHKWILSATYNIESNLIIDSIKKGFLMLIPVLYFGAIALVIKSFPIPVFQEYLKTAMHGRILLLLDEIFNVTFGLLSLHLVVSISYHYSRRLYEENPYLQLLCVVLSVICLTEVLGIGSEEFSWKCFDNTAVFMSMLIAILAPAIFYRLHTLVTRCQRERKVILDQMIEYNLSDMILPFAICILLFFLICMILSFLTGYSNMNNLLAAGLGQIFDKLGSNLFSGMLFVLISGILWFFGIHGGNAMQIVSNRMFDSPGSNDILSKSFIDVFSLMGGCGSSICLILAIFFFSNNKEHRNIAKVSAPMVMFNVNETLVYGLPIICNPILLIPFLLTPLVSLGIAYTAVVLGWMPVPGTSIEWTTPVLLSGYTSTGSVSGAIVQLISMIAGVAIYAPFVKLLENAAKERETFLIEKLQQEFKNDLSQGKSVNLKKVQHGLQRIYSGMAKQLRADIASQKINVHYQVQMAKNKTVSGAEALLRWQYHGKRIFPPLVIEIAKEEKMIDDLSLYVLSQACQVAKRLRKNNPQFLMSINMVAEQLNDSWFVNQVIDRIQTEKLMGSICIEITEETNLDGLTHIKDNIMKMRSSGILFAMDDFAMGHTSIRYLQESLFDFVKLDGELVGNMLDNSRSTEIISSILALGHNLNFKVVAEYVDSKEKERELRRLGCDFLQGYYYSQAVEFTVLQTICEKRQRMI